MRFRFRLQVNDQQYGWRNIKFNFIASQSSLLQVSMQIVTQFSGGEDGKYSVYRPIQNFNNFQIEPVIRVFIHGLQLQAKPLIKFSIKQLINYYFLAFYL